MENGFYEEDVNKDDKMDQLTFTDDQIGILLDDKQQTTELKGIPVAAFGPFAFEITPDIIKKKFTVTVTFYGIPIGDVTLSEHSATASLGPNIGFAKASIAFTLDWGQTRLLFEARACVRKLPLRWKCKKYSGVIYNW